MTDEGEREIRLILCTLNSYEIGRLGCWWILCCRLLLFSRAIGKPVKVVWSREEDMQHDVYRPATLQRITAGLDRAGKPAAIAHNVVSPSILQYVFAPAVTEDNDPSCLEELMESHYQIPSQRVDFHLLKIGPPTSGIN